MGQEFAFPTHSQVMLMLLVDWGPHLEDRCDTQALHLLDGVLGEADSASDGVSAWGQSPDGGGTYSSGALARWSVRGTLALSSYRRAFSLSPLHSKPGMWPLG